jgi:hypothetical protein
VLVAVLVLLLVLVARADADDDDDLAQPGDPATAWSDDTLLDREPERYHLHVPLTHEMIARARAVAPPIASVVAAAHRAAGLRDDPTRGWRRRSRLSALLPSVSVRAGQNQAWVDVIDPTIRRGVAFDVRASWRIERLLFDPNEPRIATLDVARRRDKRRVAMEVIHVYFDWVAAPAAAEHDGRAVLAAAEQTAELDALTAGWFSQTLASRLAGPAMSPNPPPAVSVNAKPAE